MVCEINKVKFDREKFSQPGEEVELSEEAAVHLLAAKVVMRQEEHALNQRRAKLKDQFKREAAELEKRILAPLAAKPAASTKDESKKGEDKKDGGK